MERMDRSTRNRRGRLAAAVGALAVVGALLTAPGSAGAAIAAQLVAGGLDIPVTFTFADDGTILYGERFTGEIRWYDPDDDSDALFVDVGTVGMA